MFPAAWMLAAVAVATARGGGLPGKSPLLPKSCSTSYSTACLKAEAAGLLDRLSLEDELQLLPGVRLLRDNSSGTPQGLAAELAREHPNDVGARLDAFLARRVQHFLGTHVLSVRLPDPAEMASWATDVQTGRGKNKGQGMQMMMAAMGMMKAALGALGMGAVALLAGKALMTGLLALMLAAIVGLKSLAGGGGGKVTYEIVSKPVVSHVDTHSHEVVHDTGHHGYGHSSYGRSLVEDEEEGPGRLDHSLPQETSTAGAGPGGGPGGGTPQPHRLYLPLTAPGADGTATYS